MDRYFERQYTDSHNISDNDYRWATNTFEIPMFDLILKHKKGENLFPARKKDKAEVNFSLPDKVLIESFKEYLKHTRERYPELRKPSPIKKPNYNDWIKYAILPYIDLTIWAKEQSVSITNRVYSSAIFDEFENEGEFDENTVRRTTKTKANSILTSSYLDLLSAVVAKEISEN
jgi:hypothetical protein